MAERLRAARPLLVLSNLCVLPSEETWKQDARADASWPVQVLGEIGDGCRREGRGLAVFWVPGIAACTWEGAGEGTCGTTKVGQVWKEKKGRGRNSFNGRVWARRGGGIRGRVRLGRASHLAPFL